MTATTLTPKTLTEIFACSGGTNGTVINVAGNIVEAPCPAFGFDAVTHAPLGLRVRGPQRANMVNNSDSSVWGYNSPNTPIPNAFLGRPGTRIVTGSVAGDAPNRQSAVINTAGGSLCASILVDVSTMTGQTSRSVLIWVSDADGAQLARMIINADGTPGALSKSGANVSAEAGGVIKIAGSIYMVWVSATFAKVATTANLVRIYIGGGATGDGVVLGCPQIEAANRPSSYIPTDATGTNRTRAADLVSLSNLAAAPWFNPAEGTLLVDCIGSMFTPAFSHRVLELRGGSDANRVLVAMTPTGSLLRVDSAGTAVANLGDAIAAVPGQPERFVVSWKANRFLYRRNGGPVLSSLSGAVPTGLVTMSIGATNGAAAAFDGHIQNLLYWPKAANATEILAMTPTTEVIAG